MIFLILIFAFDTDYKKLKLPSDLLIIVGIIVIALTTISISLYNTPFFDKPSGEHKKIAKLLEDVDDSFIIVSSLSTMQSHRSAYYSYAVVELNKRAAEGHYPAEANRFYLDDMAEIQRGITSSDCETFLEKSRKHSISYFIGHEQICTVLSECGLKNLVKQMEPVCLYKIPK